MPSLPCELGLCTRSNEKDGRNCSDMFTYLAKTGATGAMEINPCPRNAADTIINEINNPTRHSALSTIIENWGVVLPEVLNA